MAREEILVVDDEPAIVHVIRERLEGEGFVVRIAGDGEQALRAIDESLPGAVVLDLMLPDMDGFEVLRRMRGSGCDLPVIILTARDDDVDVLIGLELGADDYMVKPFNPRELAARVRALLRRRAEALALAGRVASLEAQLESTGIRAGAGSVPDHGLHFDQAGRRAWYEGVLLELRPREFDLLLHMTQHPGQVLDRSSLLDQVWGFDEYIDERTVDVHIHRLRQKLAAVNPISNPIQTERGLGYRWEP